MTLAIFAATTHSFFLRFHNSTSQQMALRGSTGAEPPCKRVCRRPRGRTNTQLVKRAYPAFASIAIQNINRDASVFSYFAGGIMSRGVIKKVRQA